jgi:hypothetical protein
MTWSTTVVAVSPNKTLESWAQSEVGDCSSVDVWPRLSRPSLAPRTHTVRKPNPKRFTRYT